MHAFGGLDGEPHLQAELVEAGENLLALFGAEHFLHAGAAGGDEENDAPQNDAQRRYQGRQGLKILPVVAAEGGVDL